MTSNAQSAETTEAGELYVVFKVGTSHYAMPAKDVLQMESYSGATMVPGSQSFVAGVVQVRGQVIPVVDLRIRFGLDPVVPTIDSRLVVVQTSGRTIALLADSAREVMNIPRGALAPPPKIVTERSRGFVREVAQIGPRLVLIVDFDKVVGEELQNVQ